jgi:hypothetical protein
MKTEFLREMIVMKSLKGCERRRVKPNKKVDDKWLLNPRM